MGRNRCAFSSGYASRHVRRASSTNEAASPRCRHNAPASAGGAKSSLTLENRWGDMSLEPDTFPLGRRETPHRDALFGVTSASWRLRQGGIAMSMAKARAALLQIAHPKIARGLLDHSTFEADPYRRVKITGQTMSTISFGSPEERTEALRLLRQLHANVRGTLQDGESYAATDPTLMWFVLATLIDSDLLVEERYIRAFDEHDRDSYYEECLAVVDAFRIPPAMVPLTRFELREELAAACMQLDIGPDARRLAARVFEPTFLRAPRPARWGYKHLLANLLPENVRTGYGFPESPPAASRLLVAAADVLLPRAPDRLRRIRLRPASR